MVKMADQKRNAVYNGTFIHSIKLDELEYMHNTSVFVDVAGKIVHIERDCSDHTQIAESKLGWKADEYSVLSLKEGEFFFPGFIGMSSPSHPSLIQMDISRL